MMAYVISLSGKPLDPTHPAKARKLVRKGKASVLQVSPFTIQLTYETSEYTQDVTLGIDSGYQHIGFSAVSEKKELISGELHLLLGMTNRIEERRSYRRTRRGRLRYRQPRFDNRKRNEGWLAPSIQHKLDSHIAFIKKMKTLLPIKNVIIEVANFDIQKIKKPDISGVDYQQGEQIGFWNVREYVLHRDHHKCQNPNCKNKAKEPILQVHHIVYRNNGGSDAPSNLITLCTKCHTSANHKKDKFLYEWQVNKPKLNLFKDSTFMSMVRWKLAASEGTNITYGYITKNSRIQLDLEKTHYNDAFVIAGGSTQPRCEPIHYQQVRRNNRSLEKFFDAKYIDIRTGEKSTGKELDSGRRTRNKSENSENSRVYRGEKLSNGQRRIRTQRYFYQPNDLVRFEGEICKVVGTMNKGKSVKLNTGKSPNPAKLTPYKFAKGMVAI